MPTSSIACGATVKLMEETCGLVYPQILSEERLVPGNRHLDVDLTTRRDQAPFQAFPCPLFASPEDGPMARLI